MRWAFGVALRDADGVTVGVLCVLDRWLRTAARREQRALGAAARQLTELLLGLRPMPGADGTAMTSSTAMSAEPQRPVVGLRRAHPGGDVQPLLRSHEVAVLFDVTERTVINWAASGKLPSLRTIGGHLRFRSDDVYRLLDGRPAAS